MDCNKCDAAEYAVSRIRKDRAKESRNKLIIICISVLLGVAMVCGTVLGCYTIGKQQETIIEQQYALNMQYASLMDYISGAEIITETTTEEANAGDGGTAVVGDNNTVAGGDVNGNS